MNKHYTVSTIAAAWKIADEIFPTDYNEDVRSSENAGYKVYRSPLNYYDYICDLGDRLELNLANGETINIWIKAEEKPAEMHKNVFTIGLFDKDTEKQEISISAAKEKIAEILIEKHGIFAFTMLECAGYYKMQSTGRIVAEPSIRVEIATDDELTIADSIIENLKEALNQESIMHEISTANIYFK